jgi:hypothetical protein
MEYPLPNLNKSLEERVIDFEKELSVSIYPYQLIIPVEDIYRVEVFKDKPYDRVRLCFVQDIKVSESVKDHIEATFDFHFPYPDGTPISRLTPCPVGI